NCEDQQTELREPTNRTDRMSSSSSSSSSRERLREEAAERNFVKMVPFNNCTLEHDLYVFHRAGLLKSINIRLAALSDTPGVENLISTLMLNKSILEDLRQYNEARRDPVSTCSDQTRLLFFTHDIEYIRSHYNIEDFIYFSHHQHEEHGHLYHFALNPIFRHYTKFFLKEILRLGYKSCLYYPVYPKSREGKSSYAHSLTSALHYLVPVRPRRQIVYPLEKLGINAPSKEVSKDPVGSRAAAGREAQCQLTRAWQMGGSSCLCGADCFLITGRLELVPLQGQAVEAPLQIPLSGILETLFGSMNQMCAFFHTLSGPCLSPS
ncbi:Cilia- and flagella-associated protein 61, partial [Galemys pyrenaicus]